MKSKLSLAAASLAAGAALLAGLVGAASSSAAAPKTVKCAVTLTTISSKSPSVQLGTVKCPKPLGQGLQANASKSSVSGNAVTVSGKFKQYFDLGTMHGTFRLAGSTQTGQLKGTATFAGGTGAYAKAAGKGTVTCASPANSSTSRCTLKATFSSL